MKKNNFQGLLIIVLFALIAVSFVSVPMIAEAGEADSYASNQYQITENDIISDTSAYLFLKETDQSRGMSYVPAKNNDENDVNYNKLVTFSGMQGRQYKASNVLTMKFDKGFADESDSVFVVNIDYYDYGGGGYFNVEYLPRGQEEPVKLAVLKQGDGSGGTFEYPGGKWWRVSMLIEDANFTGKLPGGADIRIYTSAWNAFAKVEVLNISKNTEPTAHLGTFNMSAAQALNKLGLFDGFGTDGKFDAGLAKVLTRQEALKLMMTAYGLGEDAVKRNLKPASQNVDPEYACYAGLAQEKGIIDADANLDLKSEFTQRELIVWYLKLMGFEDSDLWGNAYKLAEEQGWIISENMIMQPERTANVDALVLFAVNTFAESNRKTGYNAFSKGFEEGIYTYQTIVDVNHAAINKWMQQNPFKLPSTTVVDPLTGRTYHTVNLFGKESTIPYFTQRCVSMDNKRVYFNTADLNLWEYNIETEMCRWIAKCGKKRCFVITPLNNLWYANNNQIHKVDLDTYEDTVVCDGVPGYNGYYQLMQVNNDETWLSCELEDVKVPEDVRPYRPGGRYINLLNLKTGEWVYDYYFQMPAGNPTFNHFCINPKPEYKNYVFFAHEHNNENVYTGGNTYQFDRNWMLNTDTNEYFNVFNQRWYIQPEKDNVATGIVSTGSNHESWSGNGEWFGTATYPMTIYGVTLRGFTRGVMALMRPDGSDVWHVPADYSATQNYYYQNAAICHSSMNWDASWIIGDTSYNSQRQTDFNLTETKTGKNYLLARFPHNGANNGHVHPQFSNDSSFVVFGGWTPDFKVAQWGWMDVSDITSNPSEGSRFDISESCESFSYKGDFDHYIEPTFNEDGSVKEIKIPAGRQMYVDVKKTVVEKDNTPATITITYKDDSKMPLKLCYYTWNENAPGDINELAEHEFIINRKGTGKRLTKTIKLKDICLGNMEVLRSDFRVRAAGGDATVYSVNVSVPDGK